jgi:hypothetical protein
VLKRLGVKGLMSRAQGMRISGGKAQILRKESVTRGWRKSQDPHPQKSEGATPGLEHV